MGVDPADCEGCGGLGYWGEDNKEPWCFWVVVFCAKTRYSKPLSKLTKCTKELAAVKKFKVSKHAGVNR